MHPSHRLCQGQDRHKHELRSLAEKCSKVAFISRLFFLLWNRCDGRSHNAVEDSAHLCLLPLMLSGKQKKMIFFIEIFIHVILCTKILIFFHNLSFFVRKLTIMPYLPCFLHLFATRIYDGNQGMMIFLLS